MLSTCAAAGDAQATAEEEDSSGRFSWRGPLASRGFADSRVCASGARSSSHLLRRTEEKDRTKKKIGLLYWMSFLRLVLGSNSLSEFLLV